MSSTGKMSEKQMYEARLDADIRELNARIELLRARTAKAAVQTRMAIGRELDRLAEQKSALAGRLDELRGLGEAGWEKLRDAVNSAKREVADGLEAVAAKLR